MENNQNNNLTVWQRLSHAFGPNALLNQDYPTYKFDRRELLKTTSKQEYEKELLQAQEYRKLQQEEENNRKNEKDKEEFYDEETETLIINQSVYPYYLDILQKSRINKFINVNEMIEMEEADYIEKVSDIILDNIINHIVEYLKNKNLDKYIIF